MDTSKFKFQNGLKHKPKLFLAFLRQTALWEQNPQKSVQITLQFLNPVNNTNILAPELEGDQSEMVV